MTSTSPSTADRFLTLLATGFGVGRFPIAPGTAGSALGVLLIWMLPAAEPGTLWMLLAGAAAFFAGIPICNAGIRVLNAKDPSPVVYDEIAAFFWVFAFTRVTPASAAAGFILFRLFDILKPWPIRRFERLPGGWGVMTDDALAGMVAGMLLAVFQRWLT